ncbi:tetratricopeptide repeat protein [Catenulispora sp. NF23]|uniref:Tetratricopeptide repeat protein n=1 Tax=Catenulispora pinistramenti TaxID=2705254 RepID=A0ABS5KZ58_9ACTN|nr:tetratricopeptide repeat protein [Catenulispora pinistramenti]MBS2531840.1 tetratricopeptide repeat protein [Catenulispora pinistramenti]MBS2551361.1 tetratricopeptide repeat protein [Catenulispora pinistramenti]
MSGNAGTTGEPDPEHAADLVEFIELLDQLRMWAGSPSTRALAKRVGPLLRPPRTISHSTVAEVFQTSRRRLDLDLVAGIVRALGADDATVARWRTAYLRVLRDTKAADFGGVLRQLPVDLPTFIGREKELAALMDAATEGSRTLVISAIEGMAGIGKTQLALHAAHRLVRAGRYADLQLYANLRGFDPYHEPSDPAAILDVFLRQLQVPAARVPAGLDERAAMFRDRIHGRQALLLLDNAADDNQLRPLLPASSSCLVLITSRRTLASLEGARTVALDVLDPSESIEMLSRIVGPERVAAEPRAAARIAELCGGLPLAVSLAAARLRSRPVWTLRYLADRLATTLDQMTTGGRGLSQVFDLSYQGLPTAAQRVFRLLGIHPAGDFTASSITALTGMDLGEAERILELLQDEKLIQQKVLNRFELHDLLRAYAAERAAAEISEQERSEAIAAVLNWYVATASAAVQLANRQPPLPFPTGDVRGESVRFVDAKQALAWYDLERPNLLRAFSAAAAFGHDRTAVNLALAMKPFEDIARSWRESERLLRAALPHARRWAAPDVEATVLQQLGFTLFQDNRFEQALDPLEEALALSRENGDLLNEHLALNVKALAYTGFGDHRQGLEIALQALALREHDEVRQTPRTTGVYNTVATCLHGLGRPAEAVAHIITGTAEAQAQNDWLMVAVAKHNLGFTYLVLERFADAITAFEESVPLSHDLGFLYLHADDLNGIARALHAQGRVSEAEESHRKALAVLDDLPEAALAHYLSRLDESPLRYPPPPADEPGERNGPLTR